MGHIICIASLKGGVGKTTTAVNLSAAFAMAERKTLLVDFDPQGNATTSVGIDKRQFTKTLYDAFVGKASVNELIFESDPEFLKIVPARGELSRIELELMSKPCKEKILRGLLADLRQTYDYIIIDTPPSLGFLSVNALIAADSVLIPLQCEFLAFDSLVHLLRSTKFIREKFNPSLKLAGILLTMYDMGEKVSQEISKTARKHLKNLVFETIIPRSVQLRESPSIGKPLLIQDRTSVGAQCYLELAREIMRPKAAVGIKIS